MTAPPFIESKDESSEHPVEVVLRFTLRVADRVASTAWHESQELKHLPEEGVKIRLVIAEPIEILPRILGWVKECEVVAPADLRDSISGELDEALAAYRDVALTRSMAG